MANGIVYAQETVNSKILQIKKDESGFSSHSKFTSVFKKVKGLTSSEYIRSLK